LYHEYYLSILANKNISLLKVHQFTEPYKEKKIKKEFANTKNSADFVIHHIGGKYYLLKKYLVLPNLKYRLKK